MDSNFVSIIKCIALFVIIFGVIGGGIFVAIYCSQGMEVKRTIKKVEEDMRFKDYDSALSLLDARLRNYPDSEVLMEYKVKVALAKVEKEVADGLYYNAMSHLEEYYQSTKSEVFTEKKAELEENASAYEKHWKLKETVEGMLGTNFFRGLFWQINPQIKEQCAAWDYEDLECGYFLPAQKNERWKECVALLEAYVQCLQENDVVNDPPQVQASKYLTYSEACSYLRRLYINLGEMDKAEVMAKECLGDYGKEKAYGFVKEETKENTEIKRDENGHLNLRGLASTPQSLKKDDTIKSFDFDIDSYDRYTHYASWEELQGIPKEIVGDNAIRNYVRADFTYEGNHILEMRISTISKVEIRRYYYDAEGRIEEVAITKVDVLEAGTEQGIDGAEVSDEEKAVTDADESLQIGDETLIAILHFTYDESGIIRGDLDSYDLESGEETSYVSAFAVNEFGDLRELTLQGKKMPERTPGRYDHRK